MARKSPKIHAPETEIDAEPDAPEGPETNGPANHGHGRDRPASKSDAVRMALAAGFRSPQQGSAYIRSQFGLDVTPQHFSATKSRLKHAVPGQPVGRPPRDRRPDGSPSAPRSAVPPDFPEDLGDLKRLIGKYGPAELKRLIDIVAAPI